MNWDALGALAELAGAVGVIVSLLYLGVQIRIQNRESRLNSVSESIRHFNDVLSGIAHYPDLCSIWARGLGDFESLDPEERARFSAHVGRLFRVIEGLYGYHLEGRRRSVCSIETAHNYAERLTAATLTKRHGCCRLDGGQAKPPSCARGAALLR